MVERIGAATALETRASGVQYAFAPCIAVSISIYLFFLPLINKGKVLLMCCVFIYRYAEIQDGDDVTRVTVRIPKLFKV